jgi:hypothetical protein
MTPPPIITSEAGSFFNKVHDKIIIKKIVLFSPPFYETVLLTPVFVEVGNNFTPSHSTPP